MDNLLLSFDWVQFTAKCSNIEFAQKNLFLFQINQMQGGTQYFKNQFQITILATNENLNFALVESEPRVSYIKPDIVRVKIDNRYLYSKELKELCNSLCSELEMSFINFTRIDVCGDFQKNLKYKDNEKLLVAFGERKISIANKQKFTLFIANEKYTGVTFGSRSSGCSITIYNKTFELEIKSEKPWIRNHWAANGFDINAQTFRLEFSTKKTNKTIQEDFDIMPMPQSEFWFTKLDTLDRLKEYFEYCYTTNFKAIKYDYTRRSRCKEIKLFNVAKSEVLNIPTCEAPKSDNYIKAHLKRLATDILFYKKSGDELQAHFMLKHLENQLMKYGLVSWADSAMPWAVPQITNTTMKDVMANLMLVNDEFQFTNKALSKGKLFE